MLHQRKSHALSHPVRRENFSHMGAITRCWQSGTYSHMTQHNEGGHVIETKRPVDLCVQLAQDQRWIFTFAIGKSLI